MYCTYCVCVYVLYMYMCIICVDVFCSHLASELVEKLQEDLKTQIDRCCDELHENSLQETEDQK